MSKKVVLMEFEQNPNVGLYMFANDKFCLVGNEVDSKKRKEIEKVLEVPVYAVSCLGTDLVGVFICGNNDYLLAPDMYDYEIDNLKNICDKHKVEFVMIKDKINTFGNSICVGDGDVLISSKYSKDFEKEISKSLKKYNVVRFGTTDYEGAGSVCRFLNGKYYLSQELEEKDVKPILKKVAGVGSVNSGSNFVSSGIVGNSNGLILGSMCSTIEIQDIVENLDYL